MNVIWFNLIVSNARHDDIVYQLTMWNGVFHKGGREVYFTGIDEKL